MNISKLYTYIYIYIYIYKVKVKLATVVEGVPKAPFSLAITPRSKGCGYIYIYIYRPKDSKNDTWYLFA